MEKELFKNASYCHHDVIDYYKKMKKSGCTVPCKQIRLLASVAAAHMEKHTQVYLTTKDNNYVAVIPFTAYEFRTTGYCIASGLDYFKMGEVIHDIFAHFKKTRMSGFVITSEYVGIKMCSI